MLVRVEVRTGAGRIQRDLWDAEAILSVDPPQVCLSTNRVTLRNGLGSALVWLTGGGDVNLTATLGNLLATRLLGDLTSVPSISVSGALTNTNASWSGVVRVTGDLTIPAGSTPTIRPGTLVFSAG